MRISLNFRIPPFPSPPKPVFKIFCCCTTAQPARFNPIVANLQNEDAMLPLSSARREEKLAARWMEYQGIRNWEGLLDPLDDNLRGEILRYGYFVDATYRSFDFDPSSETYGTCRFSKSAMLEKSGLPNTGYRLTKHLRATSGIQLPRWMENAPNWIATQSSWIGYVAVCQDKAEIARLGRRDVVIAYRGTATCLEWLENLRATLTHLPDNAGDRPKSEQPVELRQNEEKTTAWPLEQATAIIRLPKPLHAQPMVESGFLSLYTSKKSSSPSLQELGL